MNGLFYLFLHENSFRNCLIFPTTLKFIQIFKIIFDAIFGNESWETLPLFFDCNFLRRETYVIIAQLFSCLLFIPRVRPYQLAQCQLLISRCYHSTISHYGFKFQFQSVKIIAITNQIKKFQITQWWPTKVIGPHKLKMNIFSWNGHTLMLFLTKVNIGVQLNQLMKIRKVQTEWSWSSQV